MEIAAETLAKNARYPRWFLAHLLYAVDFSKESSLFTIDDDLWLFQADSAEHAYQTAVSAAKRGENMGKALVEGAPTAFSARGLEKYVGIFFPGGSASTLCSLAPDRPKIYEFLGISTLRYVAAQIVSGTEIERYPLELNDGDLPEFPHRSELLAFDPSGPAYSGADRVAKNALLWRKFEWYLAEEAYACRTPKPHTWVRWVLIRAMAPDLAYDTAVRDALAASEGFLGIRGLFLIQDNMISACNLLTSAYPLSAQEIEQSVKAKMALEAFGSAGEPIC